MKILRGKTLSLLFFAGFEINEPEKSQAQRECKHGSAVILIKNEELSSPLLLCWVCEKRF